MRNPFTFIGLLLAALVLFTAIARAGAPPFDAADMRKLAASSAKALAECPGLKKGTAIALTGILNRTAEHIDKVALGAAIRDALQKQARVVFGEKGRGLSADLTFEGTERGREYRSAYTLGLTLEAADGAGACKKSATLVKESGQLSAGNAPQGASGQSARISLAPQSPGAEKLSLLEGVKDDFGLMIAADEGASESGLLTAEVQKTLKDHFRNDGLTVTEGPRMPMIVLVLSASLIQSDKSGEYYSVSVQLQIKESALTIGRTTNTILPVTVWSRDVHGVFRKNDPRFVVAWSKALIDVFVNDYNAANKLQLTPVKKPR